VVAVLHLSLLRSHLRQAVSEGLSPGEMGRRLNAVLVEALPPRSFVGLFYGAIDAPSGRMAYVNCGQTPPVLVRRSADAKPLLLYTGNIVLGVTPSPSYDEREVTLEVGDVLICCTDGITDAMNADWQAFDTEGVIRAAEAARGATAEEVAGRVLDAVHQHATHRLADDATLLAVRRVPDRGGSPNRQP
jgi:serine phosphatase RsbU (regulator of sigma subunit)